ncbi:MAG: replicative DNA helicase [Lachnospiraceae bacterium]|jgi:replicative DNA helicase|nr:replicative DNA helicase [Lachnospiraceae bacterium]
MEEALIKRILPHSVEAERSVLGSMLMDQEAVQTVSELITRDDFYQYQYGVIFEAMVELHQEGKAVDLVTVQDRLRGKDVPPEVCSLDFMKELLDSVYISSDAALHARIISDKSMLRRIIRLNDEISGICYEGKKKTEEILQYTEKATFDLLRRRASKDFVPIKDVALSTLDKIEAAARQKGNVTGIPTGFADLDYRLSGLQRSDLILLAARPSMGKTALVLNLADYICFRKNYSVAIFSLEMNKEQLMNRLFAMEARINSQSLRNGDLTDNEWSQLVETVGMIGNSRMIIDDTPGISISELRSKCRKFKLEFGLDLVMIDYLQLMSGNGRSDSRQQEVSEISRSLKALAREIDAPVIALSQLSRACETRPDHRPMLSDLRESGAIEQDADVVMFLYRDEYYNKDSPDKNIAEVIIAKQRNGPIGTVNLVWLPDFTKFVNMSREEQMKRRSGDGGQ